MDEIREFYGYSKPDFKQATPKAYASPERPTCHKPKNAVLKYLTATRKLSAESIAAYKVGEEGRLMVFPYLKGGQLVMWKKDGIDRNAEGKRAKPPFASKDTQPILFGWQAVEQSHESTRRIFLTEGELDAMSLFQYGYPALSLPFGGGKGAKQQWLQNEYDALLQYEEIYLVLDNDKVGQEAVSEIVERLGSVRCRVVTLPRKDANDCLQAGVPKSLIDEAIKKAKHIDPEELKGIDDLRDSVEAEFNRQEEKSYFFLPWVKTHEELRLEPGQLTIWNGYNGHGKSEVLLNARAYRMAQGDKVLIASMEVPCQKLIARHILPQVTAMAGPSPAYRAACYDWLSDKLWFFTLVGSAKADRLLSIFDHARKSTASRIL